MDQEPKPAGKESALDQPASDPLVGATIAGRYTITRRLGSGGMGKVYEAKHTVVARRFAIKFLHPRYAADQDVLRRFENEAKAAGGLEHPNLIAVTDFGRTDEGSPYLVMEYLAGEDCATLLRRVGPLAPARAAGIVQQACRGLAVAHAAGIVHRDLKPENLFLTDAGDGSDRVKVLDFGIAKLRSLSTDIETSASVLMGTAHYMSPEQVRGAAGVDHRTDLWSLGVVLYELLTGHRPFEGKDLMPVVYHIVSAEPPSLAAAAPDVPQALVDTVHRALAKDAMDRYQSAAEFAQALSAFAQQGPSGAAPEVVVPSRQDVPTLAASDGDTKESGRVKAIASKRPGRRSRFAPVLVLLTVGLLLALAALVNTSRRSEPSASTRSTEAPASTASAADDTKSVAVAPTPARVSAETTPVRDSLKDESSAASEHSGRRSNMAASASSLVRSPLRAPNTSVINSAAPVRPATSAGRQPVMIDTASPY